MGNQQHLALLRHGNDTWNPWRQEHPEIQPDLNGANLTETDLIETDLSRANLIRLLG